MEKEYTTIPNYLIKTFCKSRLSPPMPVKLFIGLILAENIDIEKLKIEVSNNFGQVEIESPFYPFNHTHYYNKEMGDNLIRCFWGFNKCIEPDHLPRIKLATNNMEIKFGILGNKNIFRRVNLDPGLLSLSNVILATTKNRAHRIYLGKGIYAEITLLYSKSEGWYPLDWTYPDYRTLQAKEFFQALRNKYYQQINTFQKRANKSL